MKSLLATLILASTAVLAAPPSASPVRLSLPRAVELALAPDGNARLALVRELARQADTRAGQARALLLPQIESSVAQQNQTRNLAAFGIRFSLPFPGFQFPERVGPFNVFDARVTAAQSLFDLSAWRRWQASREGRQAAQAETDSASDQVAALVAKLYLAAQVSEARLEAARANLALAEALARLASSQKAAGTGTALDVTRAQVQAANQRQRVLVAENDRRRAHLELLKAMGLDLATEVELTENLAYTPPDPVTLEQARTLAFQSRPDLQAQQRREATAQLGYSAVKWERLPSLTGFADYGSIGSSLTHALPTRTYGVAMKVPLFDGGRREARRVESLSQLRQESIRTADLRRQVELDVRLALDTLRSAQEQVRVAEDGLKLAEEEVAQAERRFRAGVSSSLEVTDAQTRLERARENRIAALSTYQVARIDLAYAMGAVREIAKGVTP